MTRPMKVHSNQQVAAAIIQKLSTRLQRESEDLQVREITELQWLSSCHLTDSYCSVLLAFSMRKRQSQGPTSATWQQWQ